MSSIEAVSDIEGFNSRWLKAWSDKDVDGLVAFYAEDCVYKDPQTAQGLTGREALRTYLAGLFAATPAMPTSPTRCGRSGRASAAAGTVRLRAAGDCAASIS